MKQCHQDQPLFQDRDGLIKRNAGWLETAEPDEEIKNNKSFTIRLYQAVDVN